MTKFLYAAISPQIFVFPAILPTEWTTTVSRCSRMPWFVYLSTKGSFSQRCSVFSLPQGS